MRFPFIFVLMFSLRDDNDIVFFPVQKIFPPRISATIPFRMFIRLKSGVSCLCGALSGSIVPSPHNTSPGFMASEVSAGTDRRIPDGNAGACGLLKLRIFMKRTSCPRFIPGTSCRYCSVIYVSTYQGRADNAFECWRHPSRLRASHRPKKRPVPETVRICNCRSSLCLERNTASPNASAQTVSSGHHAHIGMSV